MSDFRTIEIDFDVNKEIEKERRSFAESPNDALRRLLKLPAKPAPAPLEPSEGSRAWAGMGVVLTSGTAARMKYNGQLHLGQIENGAWRVGGKTFNSPSAAASGVARTKNGTATSLDGWEYWEVKRPGETHWMPIKMLRDKKPWPPRLEDL